MARELAPMGIRVNTIAPGQFETPMFTAWTKNNPKAKEVDIFIPDVQCTLYIYIWYSENSSYNSSFYDGKFFAWIKCIFNSLDHIFFYFKSQQSEEIVPMYLSQYIVK